MRMLLSIPAVSFVCFAAVCLAADTAGRFNYADYAAVLGKHVDANGMVNYERLKSHPDKLDAFIGAMARLDPNVYQRWSDNDKIAFWLNAYNALTLKVVTDHYPIKASFLRSLVYPSNSIRQIEGVWDEIEFEVLGERLTLDEIEHEILRKEFNEPRIHMALVCAALGCPPLRTEPYVGARLDEQLDEQARRFLSNPQKFRIDRRRDTVYLSSIFKWFGGDFVKTYAPAAGIGRHDRETSAVLMFIASYLEGPDKTYILSGAYRIKYLDYDWSLNERKP